MQGTRHDLKDDSELPELWEYGKSSFGWWYCETPGGMANLSSHQVTEHEDGTITVSPSILTRTPPIKEWHGFLEGGIWREA